MIFGAQVRSPVSTLNSNDVLRSTDAALRELLETVFDINETISFEDILARFKACVRCDLHCLVYIREKRWFAGPGYLRFPYLSFELKDGTLTRFSSRDELAKRETELVDVGYDREESRLCCIVYSIPSNYPNIQRIINLIKRIFVAFYKNCGSHDHFRRSVSRRFIREFYRQGEHDLQSLTRYITQQCQINVSIWDQKDEMYFRSTDQPIHLVTLKASSGADHVSLFSDEKFSADFNTSITRRNQTYGKTNEGRTYYTVRSFSDAYFIQETGHSNFKTQQKAVAIYSHRHPLDLDAISHANNLIDTFLRTTQETQYHSIVVNGTDKCVLLETELSTESSQQSRRPMGCF